MELFIYEYYASGAKENSELKRAGFAMLNAVLKDFSALKDLKIMTIFDSSLQKEAIAARYDQGVKIYWKGPGEEWLSLFQQTLDFRDAILVIAPETAGIVADLTAMAEKQNKLVFGSCSKTLKLTGNKAEVSDLLKRKGLPVPRSEIFKMSFSAGTKKKIMERFSFPLVIKPVKGAGGQGVRLIKNEEKLESDLKLLAGSEEKIFLVQEYIYGQAASVSLFVLDGKALPISLNRQIIDNQGEFVFQGIHVPYQHPNMQDILNVAVEACEKIEGLKGFIGVDLIVNNRKTVLIEINSRITLAYVALREVLPRNLAQDLLALFMGNILPEKPTIDGSYTFFL